MNRLPSMQNIPKPNPLHTTFKNHNFPANFLNETNVLDYFCNPDNIFYDMKSCNQVIRMQQIGRPLEECLQSMAGEQYVLHFARPPLFVICKQQRNLGINQNIVTPLAYYYIINGTVYQAPDAFSLVQSRLLGAVAPLGQAFEQMLKFSRFNVAKGYSWEFDKKPAPEGDEENDDEEDEALLRGGTSKKKADSDEAAHIAARSSTFQEQRTTNILQLLFEQFPPPSGVPAKPDAAAAAAAAGAAADQAAAASSAAGAAANPLGGLAAMLPPGDDGREDQPAAKRVK
ncbi:mdt-6 [Pristionchus pacificus]|nr:mdt-6 [Pristionchus pacificus]